MNAPRDDGATREAILNTVRELMLLGEADLYELLHGLRAMRAELEGGEIPHLIDGVCTLPEALANASRPLNAAHDVLTQMERAGVVS